MKFLKENIYKAEDIAKLVINICIDNNCPINNLKLQKILYYIQAEFLVRHNKPAFDEDIVAWQYGPVVESVYRKYKMNSDRPILVKEDINEDVFQKTDLDIIKYVIESKKDYSALQLSRLTKSEDPWKQTKLNNVIENKLIKNYFSKIRHNKEKKLRLKTVLNSFFNNKYQK